MDVAFIGAGKMANTLLNRVDGFEDASVVAVCDIDEEAAHAAADVRGATVYTDHHTMYESESLDAVLVAIPPFAHDDQVSEAADRGIHVFVEKPVALDVAGGRETLAAIEESEVVSASGYVYRYCRLTERAMDLLADRDVSLLSGRYWNGPLSSEWGNKFDRSGGDVVARSTHMYDLVRYFGGSVDSVAAAGSERIDTMEVDYPDATASVLYHENGTVSTVTSTISAPERTTELDIVGEGVHLKLDYVSGTITGSVDGERIDETRAMDRLDREVRTFLRAARDADPGAIRSDYDDALETLTLTWTVLDTAVSERTERVGGSPRS